MSKDNTTESGLAAWSAAAGHMLDQPPLPPDLDTHFGSAAKTLADWEASVRTKRAQPPGP